MKFTASCCGAARKHLGMAYLSKLFIDSKLFATYERVFGRWPNIKAHALVVFDGKRIDDQRNILELEGLLFGDVQVLLARAREQHKGIDDFGSVHQMIKQDFKVTCELRRPRYFTSLRPI